MRKPKKIDIFYNGKYLCSTLWASSCKEAKDQYLTSMRNYPQSYYPQLRDLGKLDDIKNFNPDNLKAYFFEVIMYKTTDKQDGLYANIGQHENGIIWAEIYEVWNGLQFIPDSAITCATNAEAKFYLHGHGVPYNNISLV